MNEPHDLRTLFQYRGEDSRLSLHEVLAGGRRSLRRRRIALGAAAVVTVGALAATPVFAADLFPRHTTVAAQPSTPATTPHATEEPAAPPTVSPRKVVRVGERFPVPMGERMWLTRTGYCRKEADAVFDGERIPGVATCKRIDDGNMAPGVGMQSSGGPRGTLATGIYWGKGTPAAIVITEGDGPPVVATLVTYPGQKGWVAYYAKLPPTSHAAGTKVPPPFPRHSIQVLDADGKVLKESPPVKEYYRNGKLVSVP